MLEFLNLKQEAFGLDISDFSLKIIKLKPYSRKLFSLHSTKKGQFLDLASFGEAKIKPGIIKKGEIRKPDELAEIIKKAVKEIKGEKLTAKKAIVSLPEEKSFLQMIQMPRLSEEDLKSAVIFEAENYIPLSLEQVYLDYQVISPLHNHLDHLDVLIVAFPRKIIDSYLDCLKKAGIDPLVFEPESLAISRALIKSQTSPQPVLLIDFGADRTVFIIFAGHSVMFTFSIPISSQSFTEAIARTMKIDLIKAESLKIKHGLKEKTIKTGEEIFQALVPSLTDLTEQIEKYLNYYQTHIFHEHLPPSSPQEKKGSLSASRKVEKILLCGSGAKLKGLANFLSSQLKIPAEFGNPWTNILFPSPSSREKELIYKKEQPLEYATALGLALRGAENKS